MSPLARKRSAAKYKVHPQRVLLYFGTPPANHTLFGGRLFCSLFNLKACFRQLAYFELSFFPPTTTEYLRLCIDYSDLRSLIEKFC